MLSEQEIKKQEKAFKMSFQNLLDDSSGWFKQPQLTLHGHGGEDLTSEFFDGLRRGSSECGQEAH
jgi:hypothetical protein